MNINNKTHTPSSDTWKMRKDRSKKTCIDNVDCGDWANKHFRDETDAEQNWLPVKPEETIHLLSTSLLNEFLWPLQSCPLPLAKSNQLQNTLRTCGLFHNSFLDKHWWKVPCHTFCETWNRLNLDCEAPCHCGFYVPNSWDGIATPW